MLDLLDCTACTTASLSHHMMNRLPITSVGQTWHRVCSHSTQVRASRSMMVRMLDSSGVNRKCWNLCPNTAPAPPDSFFLLLAASVVGETMASEVGLSVASGTIMATPFHLRRSWLHHCNSDFHPLCTCANFFRLACFKATVEKGRWKEPLTIMEAQCCKRP